MTSKGKCLPYVSLAGCLQGKVEGEVPGAPPGARTVGASEGLAIVSKCFSYEVCDTKEMGVTPTAVVPRRTPVLYVVAFSPDTPLHQITPIAPVTVVIVKVTTSGA